MRERERETVALLECWLLPAGHEWKSVKKKQKKNSIQNQNHMCNYGNKNPTFSVANVARASETR